MVKRSKVKQVTEFRLPERRALLILDDGEFAGAEIEANVRVSMGLLQQLVALPTTKLAYFEGGGDLFMANADPTWNLADSAGPIPATREGWERLDSDTGNAIISAWLKGVVQPPAPLPRPSSEPTPSGEVPPQPSSSGPDSSIASSAPTPATHSRRSSRKTPTS